MTLKLTLYQDFCEIGVQQPAGCCGALAVGDSSPFPLLVTCKAAPGAPGAALCFSSTVFVVQQTGRGAVRGETLFVLTGQPRWLLNGCPPAML